MSPTPTQPLTMFDGGPHRETQPEPAVTPQHAQLRPQHSCRQPALADVSGCCAAVPANCRPKSPTPFPDAAGEMLSDRPIRGTDLAACAVGTEAHRQIPIDYCQALHRRDEVSPVLCTPEQRTHTRNSQTNGFGLGRRFVKRQIGTYFYVTK
jgi:hypothetical protein